MKEATDRKELRERLDRLTHEIVQLKSFLLFQTQPTRTSVTRAWKDLVIASEEVSAKWTGACVIDEIRSQREK